jgi:hypothetical protein
MAKNGTRWLRIFTEDFSRNFVFHEPDGVCDYGQLDAAAANSKLYASWSDAHRDFFSTSSDQGSHWTAAVAVNIPPAKTAVFPLGTCLQRHG